MNLAGRVLRRSLPCLIVAMTLLLAAETRVTHLERIAPPTGASQTILVPPSAMTIESLGPRRLAEPASAPRPTVVARVGIATYYCCTKGYPGGRYAAAGPALRVGKWRGRWVTVAAVCRPHVECPKPIWVKLVDWCRCPDGRVIDLYPSQFSKLATLSRGIVKVRVTW